MMKVVVIGSRLSMSKPTFYRAVTRDVKKYCGYFTSATGGAYLKNQVIFGFNPTIAELRTAFFRNPTEFTTIVYSGHGYIDEKTNLDMLNINENEVLSLISLIKMCKSRKQLIILDKCSKIIPTSSNFSGFGDIVTENLEPNIDFWTAKRVFENAVKKAEPGIQVISSCSPEQFSFLDENGSHFSKSLIKSISNWANKIEPKSVLLGSGALNLSKTEIRTYKKSQTPIQIRSAENINFPIGVRLGTELVARKLM